MGPIHPVWGHLLVSLYGCAQGREEGVSWAARRVVYALCWCHAVACRVVRATEIPLISRGCTKNFCRQSKLPLRRSKLRTDLLVSLADQNSEKKIKVFLDVLVHGINGLKQHDMGPKSFFLFG